MDGTTVPGGSGLRVGVDVGGTFTDLVAIEPGGGLRVVKLPSTPPAFDRAVVDAVGAVAAGRSGVNVVHGSTVATNALLQRAGEPVAFITTDGFRDMLLIGRQNRPKLYAFRVERPRPLTAEENWFTVRERVAADGSVVESLTDAEADRVVAEILARGLRHVAVCLLFSFVNPAHEQILARRCAAFGLTVSLSSEILPEFREYERASTTVINATLRPTVEAYLRELGAGLPGAVTDLRVMHSAGGTLSPAEAGAQAAKLVLSGPAGGVLGAALVAKAAGFEDVITYDMGGTSTDVATVVGGRPQWTTAGTVDGLPIGLPAFDIHTVGAGGGSVAYVDAGGALRVGPRSAGAAPGPACYGRGGTEPTVTDANLVLGRIVPDRFLGGAMKVDPDLARRAVGELAAATGKTPADAALGIIRVAEANMARAVRAVSAQRGEDPRRFTLVSFGGAGGLHACALAESLDIPRVLVPPYCGVLSALGMAAAPAVADAARTVLHLGDALDDARLAAEFGVVSGATLDHVPFDQTASVEAYADARFRGQSHELKVRIDRPSVETIRARFLEAYAALYGQVPQGREVEIVTLRVRRIGKVSELRLPTLTPPAAGRPTRRVELTDAGGQTHEAPALSRADVLAAGPLAGPALVLDDEATTYVPPGWAAEARPDGAVVIERSRA